MAARRRLHRNYHPQHTGAAFGGPPGGKARAVAYACNAMRAVPRKSRQGIALGDWAEECASLLGFEFETAAPDELMDSFTPKPQPRDVWQKLQETLAAAALALKASAVVSPLLSTLCRDMALDRLDAEILQLMLDYETCRPVEKLWDRLSDAEGEATCLLGQPEDTIAARFAAVSALRESGLLRIDQVSGVSLLPRLVFMARQSHAEASEVRSALLGPQQAASLSLADFAHLGADAERVVALLRGALADRAKGIVVVLHGPAGTGKTELAKTLAAAIGVPLHAVGETDERGGEPSREERLADLQMAQRLLAKAEPALLLFDEAEDLFGEANDLFSLFGQRRSAGSRAFMHRLLETGAAPMIWTANSLNAFGPAILRRMTACLEVKVPPAAVRSRIWEQAAVAEGVNAAPDALARLARRLPAAPALARSAMRAARLAGGDADTVAWALSGVSTAMNGGRPLPEADTPARFDPALVNADEDLAGLADRLSGSAAPRNVSLLLSGPSGSGKSAYARFLAERMGLEVVQKRASDLLGKYVGETEKRIAAAFAEAADAGAFLIFDEADSLLADRGLAQRSWEVAQVNEMLTWMECHPLPICCTTNFLQHVDKAAMRRFLFKASFGPLSAAQCAAAFAGILGHPPPPGLSRLDRLTPADFTLVRRMAAVQGTLDDPARLLAALEREQAAKGGAGHRIGFAA